MSTLRKLLRSTRSGPEAELAKSFEPFLTPKPSTRGTLSDLSSMLAGWSTRLGVARLLGEFEQDLRDIIATDPRQAVVTTVLSRDCETQVRALALGMYSVERDRLEAIAVVVSKLAERVGGRPLVDWAREKWPQRRHPAVQALVDLRNDASHIRSRTAGTVSADTVRQGVGLVAVWLGTTTLPAMVERLLRAA